MKILIELICFVPVFCFFVCLFWRATFCQNTDLCSELDKNIIIILAHLTSFWGDLAPVLLQKTEFSSFFLSVCVLRSKILMLLSFATIMPTTVSLQSTNKHLHQIQTPQERTCRTCVVHQLIWPPGVQGHHPDRLPTETEFRFSPQNAGKSTYLQDIQVFTTKHWQINKLQIRQTYKRFKRTIFIRTKHNMQIFGVIPFNKQQNDT